MTEPLAQINLETGAILIDGKEVTPAEMASVFGKPEQYVRNAFNRWFALCQGSNKRIQSMELRGVDLRVLLELLNRMDFGNTLTVNHTALAHEMSKHVQHVSRSITRLVKCELLVREHRDKHGVHYMMDPTFAWKGYGKYHRDAITRFSKMKRQLVVVDDVRHPQARGATPQTEPSRAPNGARSGKSEPDLPSSQRQAAYWTDEEIDARLNASVCPIMPFAAEPLAEETPVDSLADSHQPKADEKAAACCSGKTWNARHLATQQQGSAGSRAPVPGRLADTCFARLGASRAVRPVSPGSRDSQFAARSNV